MICLGKENSKVYLKLIEFNFDQNVSKCDLIVYLLKFNINHDSSLKLCINQCKKHFMIYLIGLSILFVLIGHQMVKGERGVIG